MVESDSKISGLATSRDTEVKRFRDETQILTKSKQKVRRIGKTARSPLDLNLIHANIRTQKL